MACLHCSFSCASTGPRTGGAGRKQQQQPSSWVRRPTLQGLRRAPSRRRTIRAPTSITMYQACPWMGQTRRRSTHSLATANTRVSVQRLVTQRRAPRLTSSATRPTPLFPHFRPHSRTICNVISRLSHVHTRHPLTSLTFVSVVSRVLRSRHTCSSLTTGTQKARSSYHFCILETLKCYNELMCSWFTPIFPSQQPTNHSTWMRYSHHCLPPRWHRRRRRAGCPRFPT